MPRNVSNLFRKRLGHELDDWQKDGIISHDQAEQISQKYKLNHLKKESVSLLVLAIYIIGSILICAGIVSFVAAHWTIMGPWTKVCLIVSAMIACHLVGFYFWKISGKRASLGHGLVILGTLIFGANIGLLAQIFHIHSSYYHGFGAWAIGAVIMAYALQSTPNALIAVITSFIWFCGWVGDYEHAFCYYPFVAAAVFLPFAYLRRSTLTFTLALLAVGASIAVYSSLNSGQFWVWALAMLAIGQLFFAWGLFSGRTKNFTIFASPAAGLGIFALMLPAYLISFHYLAEEMTFEQWYDEHMLWVAPVGAVFLGALLMWSFAAKTLTQSKPVRPIAIAVLAAGVLVLIAVVSNNYVLSTVLSNLALFVIAAGLICGGVGLEDRRIFWLGLLLTAFVIISRFFEYETGLLVKALVFISCGIAVIYAGVKFENYLRKRKFVYE